VRRSGQTYEDYTMLVVFVATMVRCSLDTILRSVPVGRQNADALRFAYASKKRCSNDN
jgi:hypothetical protein